PGERLPGADRRRRRDGPITPGRTAGPETLMTALLLVELRRFLARRVVRAAAVAVLLGIIVAGIATAAKSHQRGDIASLEAAARAERQRMIADCLSGEIGPPPGAIPPGESRDQVCEESVGTLGFRDPRFHLASLVDVFKGTT